MKCMITAENQAEHTHTKWDHRGNTANVAERLVWPYQGVSG